MSPLTSPTPVPSPRRSEAEQARLHGLFTDLFEQRICFNQTLGLKVQSLQPDQPLIRLDMRPELVGHFGYGRLHGGVISSALDVIGAMALIIKMGDKHAEESCEQVMHRFARMGTIDLRVDFLRQGLGSHFLASAEVTRLGGRVGSTQMRLCDQDGLLIATGAAAYIVS